MPYRQTNQNELSALIYLLEDPDPITQNAIYQRFRELGRRALPSLQQAQLQADSSLRQRICNLMQELHFTEIEQHWNSLMCTPDAELEHGAFLLALHRFPGLNVRSYQTQLDDMANAVRPRIEISYWGRQSVCIEFLSVQRIRLSGKQRTFL